jgi:hypothetical protein
MLISEMPPKKKTSKVQPKKGKIIIDSSGNSYQDRLNAVILKIKGKNIELDNGIRFFWKK